MIALIITIIVIIILAAISIAGVSGVVERSRYAKFCGDLDAVQDAVSQAYGDKLVDQSLENPTNRKSSKEIYEWVAGGENPQTEEVDGKTLAELEESDRLGLDLPQYGDGKWYVDVNTGEVYLLPGFEYEDKIYSSKADIQNGGSQGEGGGEEPAPEKITFTIERGGKGEPPVSPNGEFTAISGMTWEQLVDSEIYNPLKVEDHGRDSDYTTYEYHSLEKDSSTVYLVSCEYDASWRKYLCIVCEDYECNTPVKLDEEIKDGGVYYYCPD